MNLDVVLSRTDSPSVLDEIVALRTYTSVRAKGVSQSGPSHYQFVAELDAKRKSGIWSTTKAGGHRQ